MLPLVAIVFTILSIVQQGSLQNTFCQICTNSCPNGFYVDGDGCPKCSLCLQRQCPQLSCARCPGLGYSLDVNGCQTCQCQTGALQCTRCVYSTELSCPGCLTCTCKKPVPAKFPHLLPSAITTTPIPDSDAADMLIDIREAQTLLAGLKTAPPISQHYPVYIARWPRK